MSSTLAIPARPLPATLQDAGERAKGFLQGRKSPATLRAYSNDWSHFTMWCQTSDLPPLPAEDVTVALYVSAHADVFKVSTLERRLSAIAHHHAEARLPSPTRSDLVRETMRGIRRHLAEHAPGQVRRVGKRPVSVPELRRMLATLDPDRLSGARDRALLLVGFAGAFRRSELVALDIADAEDTDDGLTLLLRRSKTDQEGEGRKVGIPYGSNPDTCPVRAWRAWLDTSGIGDGPVFRRIDRHGNMYDRLSGAGVALVVKRTARAAGIDPERLSGHSLRVGLVTAAAREGVSERVIARQTGHKSMTVLRGYIRDGSLFRQNAAAAVGL